MMCGIFCVLNSFCNNCDNLVNQLKFEHNIKNRGPDGFNFKVFATDECNLAFASSVLWLQGNALTEQPIEDSNSIFCFNGDIFSGFNDDLQSKSGDTQLFFNFLNEHIHSNTLHELSKIHGPYAFIFFDKETKKLYFGRDIFGRRSLLLGKNKEGNTLLLSSVAKRGTDFEFIELPSIGIFCFDILNHQFDIHFWQYKNKNFYSKLKELESFLSTEILNVRQTTETEASHSNLFIENDNLALLKNLGSKESAKESTSIFESLLKCETWMKNVQYLNDILEQAVCKRISTQPPFCKDCIKDRKSCSHATTGILFSGGVDCAILALLCNKYVDTNRPIDLINVSFDEPKNFESPDRQTGLQTLEELKKCCPDRSWNFVEVNVSRETLDNERENHIADLIYPLNTVLDDSLGCAMWFASRGKGSNHTAPCRVLLVGMGADELFGGYTRHRAAFKRYSWQGLQDSLDEDWQNLPYRNLGRDDRVVSDHGRQLRTPYLDENLVEYVRGLQCYERTYPTDAFPQGVGEKILLRSLAYHLGLKNAAFLRKRALQFGSRIANPKENAHELSPRL